MIADIQRESSAANLPGDEQLTLWAATALAEIKPDAELCIVLIDEAESQELNAQYRGKDYPTNVLSFPFEQPEGIDPAELGDIANVIGDMLICAQVVQREAAEQGKSPEAHWAHMVVHGCLHLCGYDHIEDDEAEEMENLERAILKKLGYPDPYLVTE
ncbi:MAG: rRNA maturation RNase YbeY [Oceanospirillaceae bacterium]|nr:rRNA maturation RNase YbeY [Oceanospirillaceae bacterium]MCP5350280.1 rRNA maturation RNase YbeY [Oceanospirillaceae bacterium]